MFGSDEKQIGIVLNASLIPEVFGKNFYKAHQQFFFAGKSYHSSLAIPGEKTAYIEHEHIEGMMKDFLAERMIREGKIPFPQKMHQPVQHLRIFFRQRQVGIA